MGDLTLRENEEVIDITSLEPAKLEKAQALAKSIDVTNTQSVIQYGVGTQSKISGFSEQILQEVRNKDAGYVGESLGGLLAKINEVDVDSLQAKKGFFAKLFGNMKAQIQKFMGRYEKVSNQIDKITDELQKNRMTLLKDITMLDSLFEKNSEYLDELDLYIAAGQIKLEELKTTVLPEMQQKAQASNDPMDAQRLQDMNQLINRFEKKLHDLKLSRMVSIQTGPQIRLIQSNNQTLVEKIQSSILNAIPLWKNQIVIAISLMRQKNALEVQKKVTDTTNELLSKNSEMLKQGTLDIARESERGIVDIETLQKVNTDLITTIEETLQIQAEGRQKRAEAEVELKKLEGELKTRLSSVGTE